VHCKVVKDVGIASFGAFVPTARLHLGELVRQWGLSPTQERMYALNGRNAVSVNALDEDIVTLSVEAAEPAIAALSDRQRPQSLLIGSESHPYAVKPSASTVAEALSLAPDVFAADVEFACKGGTAAVMLSIGQTLGGLVPSALAIGADCPQSAPGSLLEASVGAGAAAFVISREAIAATVDAVASMTSDVCDFWRRDLMQFPSVVGKFSVDEGYLAHTCSVANALFQVTSSTPEDFAYVCFHQPYASLPMAAAAKLGIRQDKLKQSLVAGKIGNTYSSCCLLGLCSVLEVAHPGERILLVSFGSGAGSDGFALTVTDELVELRRRMADLGTTPLSQQLANESSQSLSYGRYAFYQGKLKS
jgi:hydroxymethylglutaryl-CoA synthase